MPLTDEEKKWLEAHIDARIREARESIEIKLLAEVRKLSRPMELRFQGHADAIGA